MRKVTAAFLLFTFLPLAVSLAGINPEQKRRIDELKRENLKSAEPGRPQEQPGRDAPKPPLSPEDIAYLAELTLRRVTYGYDLCKLIVMLNGVENEYVALDAQVKYLQEHGLLPEKLAPTFDPMQPLRRGLTAYALSKNLKISGGLFFTLFQDSERYALKELTYKGIMSDGHTLEIISGDELAVSMTRAVNYKENLLP